MKKKNFMDSEYLRNDKNYLTQQFLQLIRCLNLKGFDEPELKAFILLSWPYSNVENLTEDEMQNTINEISIKLFNKEFMEKGDDFKDIIFTNLLETSEYSRLGEIK